MKRARVKYDQKNPDCVHVYLNAVHFGAALEVVRHAQANPPQGYRWRRVTIFGALSKGAGSTRTKRTRVTATWQFLGGNVEPMTADQIERCEMVRRLEVLADG